MVSSTDGIPNLSDLNAETQNIIHRKTRNLLILKCGSRICDCCTNSLKDDNLSLNIKAVCISKPGFGISQPGTSGRFSSFCSG